MHAPPGNDNDLLSWSLVCGQTAQFYNGLRQRSLWFQGGLYLTTFWNVFPTLCYRLPADKSSEKITLGENTYYVLKHLDVFADRKLGYLVFCFSQLMAKQQVILPCHLFQIITKTYCNSVSICFHSNYFVFHIFAYTYGGSWRSNENKSQQMGKKTAKAKNK